LSVTKIPTNISQRAADEGQAEGIERGKGQLQADIVKAVAAYR